MLTADHVNAVTGDSERVARRHGVQRAGRLDGSRERLRQIGIQRADIAVQLSTVEEGLSAGVEYLKGWIELLASPHELYAQASNEMRRRLNQAIFTRIYVTDSERVTSELSEPARELIEAQQTWLAVMNDSSTSVQQAQHAKPGKQPPATSMVGVRTIWWT